MWFGSEHALLAEGTEQVSNKMLMLHESSSCNESSGAGNAGLSGDTGTFGCTIIEPINSWTPRICLEEGKLGLRFHEVGQRPRGPSGLLFSALRGRGKDLRVFLMLH